MRRRRYLALAGAAATGGCLRLTADEEPDADTDGPTDTSPTRTATPTEVSGTWAQLGYDPANTGTTTAEQGPSAEPVERWRVGTGQRVHDSPVVAGGRVFFTGFLDEQAHLYAVDATTGSVDWKRQVRGVHNQSPAVADETVALGSHAGTVVGIDAATGTYRWQAETDAPVSQWNWPTVDDGTVYVTDQRGTLYALSADDGSEQWRTDLGGWSLSAPAVAGDRLFVTTFGPTDPSAYPEPPWTYYFFAAGRGSPVVNRLATMDATGAVLALSASDGTELWRADMSDFTVATPAVADGSVFAGCWDGRLYALSASDGSTRWQYDTGALISGSASVADDTVYVGDWRDTLHAVGTDGSREWTHSLTDGKLTSKPAVVDDLVYVSVDGGPVVAVGTDGEWRWQVRAGMANFGQSTPAVADGALFVCGDIRTRTIDGAERTVGGLFKFA